MTLLRDLSLLWSMLHVIALFLILFEPRFSWRTTLTVAFVVGGTLLIANILLMYQLGNGILMSMAFFTCTIPTLILFFILSKYRDGRFFFLFCMSDTLSFWVMQITNLLDRMAGDTYIVLLVSRLILFPLVELLFWRYLRRPFLELQRRLDRGWWLFAVVGAVYYLLIMFTAIPVDAPMPDASGVGTAFLVMLLMPLTYMTCLLSLWRQMKMYENTRQMELQRRDYHTLCQKMELGRIYRHDMRHHLSTLDGLLQQQDLDEAQHYIRSLNGGLEDLAYPVQCANSALNAVITAYLVQASNAGCTLRVQVQTPDQLPFEETDLCVILGNTLENAIHACQDLPEDMREIQLSLELTENRRLVLFVKNPCPTPVHFGPDGLPAVPQREGHGLGLQSVRTVSEKYGGLFQCQWEDGFFILQTVLMPPQASTVKQRQVNRVTTAVVALLASLLLINCVPAMADALESIPVLGPIIRVLDLRTYTFHWNNTDYSVTQPQITGAEEPNNASDDFFAEMEEKFLWYAGQRYKGYVGIDADYTVLRDDETLLILRFDSTINVGGSVDYTRHVVLDKTSGEILELSDLFPPGEDYVTPLSAEVLSQMEQAVAAGEGSYYIPGDFWAESDWFRSIAPDQDFYLDEQNRLVLVFEEYSVAPGSMGTPEFTMPAGMGILPTG